MVQGDPADPIRVVTFDSHRGDGTPIAVIEGGARLEVVAIERAWIATGVATDAPVRRGFEVRCRGGARFRLVNTVGDGWRGEPLPGPRLAPVEG